MKMKYTKPILTILLAAVIGSWEASADEGMWMVNAIDKALEKNMKQRGLKLSAREIYNADAEGAAISDAIVSMEFGCTGSMISEQGLLITNHHCAYGDVHALSTSEHNYLEDGFWAMKSEEEVNIKGKSVYFLKRVLDVTEEVEELKKEQIKIGKSDGMRRLSYLMEKKYDEETGLSTMLSSMWSGSKYYLAVYEVYKDVRLVAAPPVSSAAFGGDIDNWEWPQHKCDFAMYRVYTAPDGSPAEYSENNVPYNPKRILKISLDGYKEGDYTMILGYPGKTNRYSSSAENSFSTSVKLPISNKMRGEQMAIIKKWMDVSPDIRLKYSDYFFSLSNVQELYSGQVACVERFDVINKKKELEAELQEWIEASAERKERWGNTLRNLDEKYAAVENAERELAYFRETLIRGTRISRAINKVSNFRSEVLLRNGIKPKKPAQLKNGPDPVEENACRTIMFKGDTLGKVTAMLLQEYETFDLQVEKELFRYTVEHYMNNVSSALLGSNQKAIRSKYMKDMTVCPENGSSFEWDYDRMVEDMWNTSYLTDYDRLVKFLSEEHTVKEYLDDPMVRFFQDAQILRFNQNILQIEGDLRRITLDKEFTHALYQMRQDKGIVQYPDANSTMRLTYGTVGGLNPYDGVMCDWKTTPTGILEKYNPNDYDFKLNERQYALYKEGNWGKWGKKGMYVNFLTDNDITGGNSGSPVLNAKGELIGLAFDGNKESLASDVWYTPDYNKCVCVDIRYILWTLDHYAGMTRIIEELGL